MKEREVSVATMFLIAVAVFASLAVGLPILAHATQDDADNMCLPTADPDPCICQPKFVPKKGCVGAPNKFKCFCEDVTNGFVTNGECVATHKCLAKGTSDGKGPDQGLSKLGEMLGKLMEALKGKDGGGGGGGGSPTDTKTCTTMQPTGDKALVESSPLCYFYNPTLDPTASTTPQTDPSGGLVAIPTEGATPLKVTFAFTNGTSGCNTPQLQIDYADGAKYDAQVHTETTCRAIQESTDHTYTAAGAFAVRLKDATTGDVRGGVNLTITAGVTPTPTTKDNCLVSNGTSGIADCSRGTDTGGTNTNTTNVNTTGGTNTNATTPLFTTPLTNLNSTGNVRNGTGSTGGNSTGGSLTGGSASTGGSNSDNAGAILNFNSPQSIVQSIVQKNLPPGAYGDVKILANGTTIIAGVRDGKTEVAGFFGSNSSRGGTGAVARLCTNRPWSKNFLSYIIPPSFFDSLCTWRGYTVGPAKVTAQDAPITIGSGVKTIIKTTIGGTKAATTTTTTTKATATTTRATAKVDIWATPLTVPLGARTSVFWNTQGVTDCIETSPDGSFTQTSLKGGASTVPLTSATTFTISCIAPNGSHVTDSVVVQIAL